MTVSRHPDFCPGETALGGSGWQRCSVVGPQQLFKVPATDPPLATALGILGMPGLTAWIGLNDIGQPTIGQPRLSETKRWWFQRRLVRWGKWLGNWPKRRGCTVGSIAGGPAPCAFAMAVLGYDACLDHRRDLAAQLDAVVPESSDICWENIGGVQQAVLPRLRNFARMGMYGMIAQYNEALGLDATGAPPGRHLGPGVRKRLRIQGFTVSDSGWQRYPAFRTEIEPLVRAGHIRWKDNVVRGLEHAPRAFSGLREAKILANSSSR